MAARKSPVTLYRSVGLEMYQAGRTTEDVKQVLKVLDRYFHFWKRNTRSRDAERLAAKIWDEYGEQEAKRLREASRRRKKLRARRVPGISRQEQAKRWVREFLNRTGEEEGATPSRICSLGRLEHGFARQQIYNAIDKLAEEGLIHKGERMQNVSGRPRLIKKA